MDITRRGFMAGSLGMAGAIGAMGLMGSSIAKADNAVDDSFSSTEANAGALGKDCPWCGPGSAKGDWTATPEDYKALGGCTMPLDELNRRRQMYVDAQTEYVCSDGTVIPEVFVKARALHHTYGHGIGSPKNDECFAALMREMDEELAQAYIDAPLGVPFTTYEYAAKTGKSLEDSERLCQGLAEHAWLCRYTNDTGTFYYHAPYVQGTGEWHLPEIARDNTALYDQLTYCSESTSEYKIGGLAGAPFIVINPCDPSVVKGDLYPLDDIEKVWATKNKFSLSPCACRTMKSVLAGGIDMDGYPDGDWDLTGVKSTACDHDLFTCLSCGEEAQFWIDHGVGKEITYEQAMERLHTSIEDGFVIERTNSKNAETICSCHGDCCGIMGDWKKVGPDCPGYQNISHYRLEVNTETCAKCGACAERCPMQAIVMDEETGLPTVIRETPCVVCGQCAYICPTGSRWLVPKAEGEFRDYYESIPSQNNMMAAFRFENGYIW